MSNKVKNSLFFICIILVSLACGGGGGVDYLANQNSTQQNGTVSNVTTVSTKIQIDEGLQKAFLRNKNLTPPTIYVLLKDGSTISMTDPDGDQIYTADIPNLTDGDALMIVAKQDNLELRNLLIYEGIGNTLDAGITNEDTTARSLVIQGKVRDNLKNNQNEAATDLKDVLLNISNNKNNLKTEVMTVFEDFTNGSEKYSAIRTSLNQTLGESTSASFSLSNFDVIFEATGEAKLNNVGDDTFVPSFTVGGLSFTNVWVPNQANGTFDFNVFGDITAEAKKYNVYVKVDFVEWNGNAADLDPATINFESGNQAFPIGSFYIDEIAAGNTIHFDQTFQLPKSIPDGVYAAIFTINQYDFIPSDDNLQGEEEGSALKAMVAPATVLVGNPDKPNLRLLEIDLENFSYLAQRVDESAGGNSLLTGNLIKVPDFRMNVQVEAVAFDIKQDVKMKFELGITKAVDELAPLGNNTAITEVEYNDTTMNANYDDGSVTYTTDANGEVTITPATISYTTETVWFPLNFYVKDTSANTDMLKEEMVFSTNVSGISLQNEVPVGNHYEIYVTTEISDALVFAKPGDVLQLRVSLNHDNAVEEWTNNGNFDPDGDNVQTLNITYLEDDILNFTETPTLGSSIDPVSDVDGNESLEPAKASIQNIIFSATDVGTAGNGLSVEFINDSVTKTNASFSYSSNKLTVTLAFDGTNITSTANTLAEDFNLATDEIKDVFSIYANNTNTLTTQTAVMLTGGMDSETVNTNLVQDRSDSGPLDATRGKATTKTDQEMSQYDKDKKSWDSWFGGKANPVFYPNKHYRYSVYNADTGEKVAGKKSAIASGYRLRSSMSYAGRTIKAGSTSIFIPTAVKWGTYNWLKIWLFGNTLTVVEANAELDANIDNIPGSHFAYQVIVLNRQLYGNNYSALGNDGDLSEAEVWNTQNDDGDERFAVHREKAFSKTFWISFIPLNLKVGARGSLGVRGAILVGANNKVLAHAGPYASLSGFAELSINLGLAKGGVGAEINIFTVYQKFAIMIQIQPSKPLAAVRFEAPLEISSLDGRVYIFADFWYPFSYKRIGEKDIINWDGLARTYEWFEPLEWSWPKPDFAWVISDGVIKVINSVTKEAGDWVPEEYSRSWYKRYITPNKIAVDQFGKKVYVLSSNRSTANKVFSLSDESNFWTGNYTEAKELRGSPRARYLTYGNSLDITDNGVHRLKLAKEWRYNWAKRKVYYWKNHKAWFVKWRTRHYYWENYKAWYQADIWKVKDWTSTWGLKQARNGTYGYSLGWKFHTNKAKNFYTAGKRWGDELALSNSYLYGVATDGTIGRWSHYGKNYRSITGINAKQVAVGSKRGHLFAIDSNGKVWVRLNPTSGNWEQVTDGDGYLTATDIVGQ